MHWSFDFDLTGYYVNGELAMESINYPTQIEKASLDLAAVQREAATLRERLAEIESILTLETANA